MVSCNSGHPRSRYPRSGKEQPIAPKHPQYRRKQPPKSLLLSDPGDLRIGPVLAIPEVLADLGIRPRSVFAKAGLTVGLFRDPDRRIPFEAFGRLFDACIAATGCSHFGLLVGGRFDLSGLGPIGHLMRNAATVGDALRSLLLHLHLHDRGAAPILLAPEPASVIFGYSIYRHGTPATAQIYDAAIAIGIRILRELCGPSWKPLRVQFSHGPPENREPYERLFKSTVGFDADVSGIVLASSWLQHPIEGADAALYRVIAAGVQEAEAAGSLGFAERVQSVLHQMVLSGAATGDAVAHLFGIHERTLRRRLQKEGRNLQTLINEARFELARQLLENTGLHIADIATALQYSDPNAFSRAFSTWAHMSPTRWRAEASFQPED